MFPLGSSVRLWGGGAPAGTEPRSGQSVQLGHGSLLHQLVPTSLRLLQSHRHCLWKQVGLEWDQIHNKQYYLVICMYRVLVIKMNLCALYLWHRRSMLYCDIENRCVHGNQVWFVYDGRLKFACCCGITTIPPCLKQFFTGSFTQDSHKG